MSIEDEQRELRQQLQARGLKNQRVLNVMQHTRRDLFVPDELRSQAYVDQALPIESEQTISQPYMVALMTQELGLTGTERVLEIGTGSGYQTAILSQLCQEVVTVERLSELSAPAQRILAELGYTNIEFYIGDGTLGCPDRAPFDGIIVTAAAPEVPAPLFRQLALGGRLVIPVGDEHGQMLQVIVKRDGAPLITNVCPCRFVKLIGDAGWPE